MENLQKSTSLISKFQFIKHELNSFVLKEFKLLLFLFLIVSSVLMIIFLAALFFKGTLLDYDENVLRFFRGTTDLTRGYGPEWLLEIMRDITALGGVAFLTILVTVVTGYLLILKKYNIIFYLIAAVFGGALLSLGLKEIISRERPDEIYRLMTVSTSSFPSGHSMLSATTYLSIAALLSQIQPRLMVRLYVIICAFLIVFSVGLSRMYLGVHYFSDVLAGWSVGLAWASICWYLFWMRRKKEPEKFTV